MEESWTRENLAMEDPEDSGLRAIGVPRLASDVVGTRSGIGNTELLGSPASLLFFLGIRAFRGNFLPWFLGAK